MRKTTQKEDKRQGKFHKNENRDMIEAVAALAKEKNISKELLFSAIEEALKSAYKNNFSKEYGMPPSNANVRVELNRETGAVRLYARKTVERRPPTRRPRFPSRRRRRFSPVISRTISSRSRSRRITSAASPRRRPSRSSCRRSARPSAGKVYDDFIEKENEILTAIVRSVDPETKDVYVELGKTEGVLEPQPADGGRRAMRRASASRSTCVDVSAATGRARRSCVSRTHPGLVKRLFELEVPEIQTGMVQIKSIAREAGMPHEDGRAVPPTR